MTIRIVFMGTPEFSVPALRALAKAFTVAGVVTQPDMPVGRGKVMTPSAVKTAALELQIPLIQPKTLREPEAQTQLAAWQADVFVVTAYGQILRRNVLMLPPHGCVNIHASFLPRWRGAAPIQAAIYHGDTHSGVSIMQMDAGIDTGPVYLREKLPILRDDTGESLSRRLSELGAAMIVKTLPAICSGELKAVPQEETGATYAGMLCKEDGLLDFRRTALELAHQVRAYYPWPGTFFYWNGQPVKVISAFAYRDALAETGKAAIFEGKPALGTGEGMLVIDVLQMPGKKAVAGDVFLRGARSWGQGMIEGKKD